VAQADRCTAGHTALPSPSPSPSLCRSSESEPEVVGVTAAAPGAGPGVADRDFKLPPCCPRLRLGVRPGRSGCPARWTPSPADAPSTSDALAVTADRLGVGPAAPAAAGAPSSSRVAPLLLRPGPGTGVVPSKSRVGARGRVPRSVTDSEFQVLVSHPGRCI
jgi:hypothetical protein